jgi:uncharacterized membrane protein
MQLMPLLVIALMYATMHYAPTPTPAYLTYALYGYVCAVVAVMIPTLTGTLRAKWIIWTLLGGIPFWSILLVMQLTA